MDETIKAMIEALETYGAGYVKVELGKYTFIIADKETAEFIDQAIDEVGEDE